MDSSSNSIMLKIKGTTCLLPLLFALMARGQSPAIDNLKKELANAKDTARAGILVKLAEVYVGLSVPTVYHVFPDLNKLAETYPDLPDTYNSGSKNSIPRIDEHQKDSLLHIAKSYAIEAESLSRKLNYNRGTGIAMLLSGNIKMEFALKNLHSSIDDYLGALPYLKISGDRWYTSYCYYRIASACHFIGKLDKSIMYYDSAIHSFQQLKDTLTTTECMIWQGHSYFDKGDYKNSYFFGTQALNAADKTGDSSLMILANVQLEELYLRAGLPETAIDYLHRIISLHPLTKPEEGKSTLPFFMIWGFWVGGEAYMKLNRVDSMGYLSQYIPEDTTDGDSERFYGQLYTAMHQEEKALPIFVRGFQKKKEMGHEIGTAGNAIELGQIYFIRKDFKPAIYYTTYGFATAEKIHALLEMKNAAGILSDIYGQTGDYRQAYHYSQLYKTLNDSLASEEDRRKLSLALIQNELDNQKQRALLLTKENQIKQQQLNTEKLLKNLSIAGIVALSLIAIIFFRNYRQKQKANNLLEAQKKEIQNTLTELKSTQAQLIQSEKMASLGQLTAGIAHEIQNPLNFVNNFSDVNSELIDEAGQEIDNGNINEVKIILNDLKENEQKINHHGKRADAIVKGMLQHSRVSTGQNESTDINKLADEYLRLSYHGMRAKDKTINATLQTDFDSSIGKINVVPQDIGRVLLNLYNNAFYAVTEKKKMTGENYQPTVSVVTKHMNSSLGDGGIEVHVKDNGTGIPQKVVDKIFQPFFTTKPTGQGTGLGLSLSYDIIKAHGGEIKVETKEGEGSEFVIQLPV